MTLRQQAENIRTGFERGTIPEKILAEAYQNYAKIEDIQLFIARAKTLFPNGNCGLATVCLRKALGTGEIIQGFYQEEPHTFLSFGKQIIDITADQYGGPKVYVGPLIKPWAVARGL